MICFKAFLFLALFQSEATFASKTSQALQRSFECQMNVSDKNETEILNFEIYGCGKSGPAQVVLWKPSLKPTKFLYSAKCIQDGKTILDALKIEFDTDDEFLTVNLNKRDDDMKRRRTGNVSIKGKKISGTTECLVRH